MWLLEEEGGFELEPRWDLPSAHPGEKGEVGEDILGEVRVYKLLCTLSTTSKGELPVLEQSLVGDQCSEPLFAWEFSFGGGGEGT